MTPLQVAITQLDIKEEPIGSNWGKDVKKYLNSVGINFPASWCAAFVYWCFKTADPATKLTKTGGVLNMWNKTPLANRHSTPAVGDIFILDYGKGLGHTGIVERVENGMIWTIEGNTNDTGAREGFEVCRRRRVASKCKGFIRL